MRPQRRTRDGLPLKENGLADHQSLIRSEFTRQAATIDSAIFFTDGEILARIRQAAALTRGLRALDVACGPGIVAEALAQDAGEVIACDITPEMLARASQRCTRAGLENVRCLPGNAEAALAKSGVHTGIGLRLEDDKLLFEHHPLFVVAERKRV
jgi:2-polyprenyl-3-methyl-5-hydroxy-6-metoxy-1,4-benzoquinol methylase